MMCDECRKREERDRQFWLIIRRALIMAAAAIEKRYPEKTGQRKAA